MRWLWSGVGCYIIDMRIILIFLLFLLFACGEVPTLDEDFTDEEKELYENHKLLKAYFYHPERIKQYSQYQGMEVDSMYSSLEDYLKGARYTRYFKPANADDILDILQNSDHYYSFGFERILREDTLVVVAVYPNSPANSAGLRKWDMLLFADDIPLTGENAADYEESDKQFNKVTVFKVLRGDSILTLQDMEKKDVLSSTVFLDTLHGVPFITVTEFTSNTNNPLGTYQEFKDALQEIKGFRSAIIDLRGNPGGSIFHCTKMAAELSPLDKEMLYDVEHYPYRNKNIISTNRYYARNYLSKPGDGLGIKWVVMIDNGSASCAERFAAALKSTRPETVFIGQETYGKGIGQNYIKTYLGGLAGITSLQTYYPDGKTFHEVGIEPNIYADPYSNEIYEEALRAAAGIEFGLAKLSANLGSLPRHATKKTDLGAYELFHERE
jgi:C-terminal peptidase prc